MVLDGKLARALLCFALLLALVLHNCNSDKARYGEDYPFPWIHVPHKSKLSVELYYSPVDADMEGLFRSQVLPVAESALGQYIDVKLIPFARCLLFKNATTGETSVVCEDGPEAADAGLQQFCGYEMLTAETDKFFVFARNAKRYSVRDALKYILCALKPTFRSKLASKECLKKIKKRPASIDRCTSLQDVGSVGWAFERMKQVGVKTFPTIVTKFEQHDKAQDAEAQRSLWNVVCRSLGRSAPEECRNVTRRTANESAAVTTTTEASTTTVKSNGIGLVGHTLLPCLLIMSASAFL